mgnify:FL=1
MNETAKFGKLDQLTIKNNAWKQAWGLRFEAMQGRFSGEMALMGAKNKARGMLVSGIAGDAAAFAGAGSFKGLNTNPNNRENYDPNLD